MRQAPFTAADCVIAIAALAAIILIGRGDDRWAWTGLAIAGLIVLSEIKDCLHVIARYLLARWSVGK